MKEAVTNHEDDVVDYKVDYRATKNSARDVKRSGRPAAGRRRSKSPAQVNGIHRRRQKRVVW